MQIYVDPKAVFQSWKYCFPAIAMFWASFHMLPFRYMAVEHQHYIPMKNNIGFNGWLSASEGFFIPVFTRLHAIEVCSGLLLIGYSVLFDQLTVLKVSKYKRTI